MDRRIDPSSIEFDLPSRERARRAQRDYQPFWWAAIVVTAVGLPFVAMPLDGVLTSLFEKSTVFVSDASVDDVLSGLATGLRIGPCLGVLAFLVLLERSLSERLGIAVTYCLLYMTGVLLTSGALQEGSLENTFWFEPQAYRFAVSGIFAAFPAMLLFRQLKAFRGWIISESLEQRRPSVPRLVSIVVQIGGLILASLYLYPWISVHLATGSPLHVEEIKQAVLFVIALPLVSAVVFRLVLAPGWNWWKLVIFPFLILGTLLPGATEYALTQSASESFGASELAELIGGTLFEISSVITVATVLFVLALLLRQLEMQLAFSRALARQRLAVRMNGG